MAIPNTLLRTGLSSARQTPSDGARHRGPLGHIGFDQPARAFTTPQQPFTLPAPQRICNRIRIARLVPEYQVDGPLSYIRNWWMVASRADDAGPCVVANRKESPMSLIKRPNSSNWYYLFQIHGRKYFGSTGTPKKTLAVKVEAKVREDAISPT
jgi:hypothetical protein